MQVRFSVLSQDDRDIIHQTALSILERVGVRVKSPALFTLLRSAALPSDETSETVYFPA